MRLEDQCCSLELAKELKGLGVKQESAFYWMLSNIDGQWKLTDTVFYEKTTMLLIKEQPERIVSAFTVGELGEFLPVMVQIEGKDYRIHYARVWCGEGRWCSFLSEVNKDSNNCRDIVYDQTEADTRAKTLIHLIEKGLVTP